jgi:hypothetical protein
MKRIAISIAILAASTAAASAQFCALYFDGTRSCGIPTFQSCLASVSGVGGHCQQDYTSAIPPNFMQRSRDRARDNSPEGAATRRESPCQSLIGADPCVRR